MREGIKAIKIEIRTGWTRKTEPGLRQGGIYIMAEKIYSISEAAAMVEVETHVLRYWEEELEINIKRNDMGHRCYEDRDVKILQRVKILKDKGIQLKAIKDMVHRMYEMLDEGTDLEESHTDDKTAEIDKVISDDKLINLKSIDTIRVTCGDSKYTTDCEGDTDSRIVDFKMAQFQNIMDKIVSNSIKDNIKQITQSVSGAVTEDVVKQLDMLIQEKEEQEEARYRRLDSTIRELQQTRQEIAASEVDGKKRGFFKKKRK